MDIDKINELMNRSLGKIEYTAITNTEQELQVDYFTFPNDLSVIQAGTKFLNKHLGDYVNYVKIVKIELVAPRVYHTID